MEERGRVGKGGGVGWGDNRLTAVEDAERREGRRGEPREKEVQ